MFCNGEEETITETNIVSESMKIKQSICDESKLKFGGCIASEFSIDLINTADRSFSQSLVGKWISVQLTQKFPSDEPLVPSTTLYPSADVYSGENKPTSTIWYIFSGYIDSAERDQNDKNIRHIIAYDIFAKMYDWDATNALQEYWSKYEDGVTLDALLYMCLIKGISWDTAQINNIFNENINKTSNTKVSDIRIRNKYWLNNPEKISYGELLRDICEMVGGFGVIMPYSGKGTFTIRTLSNDTEIFNFYESFYAEEYTSLGYSAIKISADTNEGEAEKTFEQNFTSDDIETDKVYDITENILVLLHREDEWDRSIENLYSNNSGKRLYNCEYTPISATLDGRLWVEVGDKINVVVNRTDTEGNYLYADDGTILTETIESYVLSRTLSGIKALTDTIETKGDN